MWNETQWAKFIITQADGKGELGWFRTLREIWELPTTPERNV